MSMLNVRLYEEHSFILPLNPPFCHACSLSTLKLTWQGQLVNDMAIKFEGSKPVTPYSSIPKLRLSDQLFLIWFLVVGDFTNNLLNRWIFSLKSDYLFSDIWTFTFVWILHEKNDDQCLSTMYCKDGRIM